MNFLFGYYNLENIQAKKYKEQTPVILHIFFLIYFVYSLKYTN